MVFILLIYSIGEIEARDRASKLNSDGGKVEMALGILGGSSVLLLITTVLLIVMANNRSQRQKSNSTQNEGSSFKDILIGVILKTRDYIICVLLLQCSKLFCRSDDCNTE